MDVTINIENVIERFGKGTIISGLSLDMRLGEFFILLGPSGCGRATLLRMIVGFNSIEDSETKIGGKVINNIPTSKRSMEMVFQNYAIFPHMSVHSDVASELKSGKMSQAQIESQVDEILKVVEISHLERRVPSKLSGGQQQRMALARAIVIHPEVLLMDKPLSNPDTRLRVKMRNTVRWIQQRMGITTLYMIHDQKEALTVSDRIAVMNGGVIQQIDTPKDIYQHPANLFVSTFIGLSNILDDAIGTSGNTTLVRVGDYAVAIDNLSNSCVNGQPVKVSIRPEEFILNREVDQGIPAIMWSSVFLGVTTHYFVETADRKEMEVIQNPDM